MLRRRSSVLLLSCAVTVGCAVEGNDGPGTPAQKPPANADAQILQDFQHRLDKYVELRNGLKKQAPPLKETKDPAKIQAAQEGLSERIRAMRKDAKPGDIFTPEIRQLFRRLMYPEMKGQDGADTKQAIKEDAPTGVPIKVNAKYPESAPLPTVPPNLLAALPKLPEDLEYRFINRDLILLDVRANVIVDFIQNAIR
jgi:hypothetical protein